MLGGFQKIVEERIKKAQRQGAFENLEGAGKPLAYENDHHIPEDLRLAYKMLKNAGFVPPEVELRKEIHQTEELLAGLTDELEKYRALKKLNLLIMKLNSVRNGSLEFDIPQKYHEKLVDNLQVRTAERS